MTAEHQGTGIDRHTGRGGRTDHEATEATADQADARLPTDASTDERSEPEAVDNLAHRTVLRSLIAKFPLLVVVLVGVAATWLVSATLPLSWLTVAVVLVCLTVAAGAGAIVAGIRLQNRGQAIRGEVYTEAGVALLVGVVVGLILVVIEENRADHQDRLEDERNEAEARRDDIRFVREAVIQGEPTKPFARLDLVEAPLAGLDLTDATFTDAELRRADLTRANLRGADLSGADLRGARLDGADLTCADLTGANLRDANLDGARLIQADLSGADLPGMNFPFPCVPLTDINPRAIDPRFVHPPDLTGANLRDADLTGAFALGATLTAADLTCADLTGANLRDANLDGARLNQADLTGVDVDGDNFHCVDLTGVAPILDPADLTGASLSDAKLTNTNLFGVDLSVVDDLDGANVTDARYDGTTSWPEDSRPPR